MPTSPVYKGGEGWPAGPPWCTPKRGILLGLQVLVGFHLKGERGKEGEGEGEGKGGAPPFLVLFGLKGEGRVACPGRPSLSPLRPIEAH